MYETPPDRAQIMSRIAAAGALANTSETIPEIEKWTALEWQLRETSRPTARESYDINWLQTRIQQTFQQDKEARERAVIEMEAGSRSLSVWSRRSINSTA